MELVITLGAAILVGGALAKRFRVAVPVVLLAGGGLLGLAPALRTANLPPQVMLLVFLPALLYWESLNTSVREIRSNLRLIVPLVTVFVIVVAGVVAVVAHAFGLPWGPAWVLRRAEADFRRLRLALIARKRARVVKLRDAHHIDDTVLRRIQAQLDAEELRLSRRDLPD
nr:cation:proton antiporter [Planosporangium thailandense]